MHMSTTCPRQWGGEKKERKKKQKSLVVGGENPFQGVTAMSSEAVVANKFKGKALVVYHFFGDALWAFAPGSLVPNAGFSKDVIRGIQLADDSTDPAQEEPKQEDTETLAKTGKHICLVECPLHWIPRPSIDFFFAAAAAAAAK